MSLYMRQKVMSWRDRFYIKGDNGEDKYYAEGEIFTWGKQLHIYDMAGREVAYLRQKVFSWLPTYFISIDGSEVAKVVKEFTFFKPRYRIEGLNWTVEGDFFAHNYSISSAQGSVATVYKEWLTWGDCYTINIAHGYGEPLVLASVLAIDCAVASQNNSSSAINN